MRLTTSARRQEVHTDGDGDGIKAGDGVRDESVGEDRGRSGALLGQLRSRVGDMRGRTLFNSTSYATSLEHTYAALWELKAAGAAGLDLPHLFQASPGFLL